MIRKKRKPVKKIIFAAIVIGLAFVILFLILGKGKESKRIIYKDYVIVAKDSNNKIFRIVLNGDEYSENSALDLEVYNPLKQEVITKISIKDDNYGSSLYGPPQMEVFHAEDGGILILLYAQYGGDGSHTRELLQTFLYSDGHLSKIGKQFIANMDIKSEKQRLEYIDGFYVFEIPGDGLESAMSELDIFKVPIRIKIDSKELTTQILLTKSEKKRVLKQFKQRKSYNVNLYPGNHEYEEFVNKIEEDITAFMKSY